MKNLWMNLETLAANVKNPIEVIREQSDFLSEGTKGLLCISDSEIGRISAKTNDVIKQQKIEAQFKYRLEIASDFLPEYSYNFASLLYGITFYPLLVTIPREIAEEIEKKDEFTAVSTSELRKYYNITNQDELENILAALFNCEKIRTVLQNMKSIIGDVGVEE